MSPVTSRWRSPAHYRHVEQLSPSDIAWEFLRRNVPYARDYHAFARSADPDGLLDRIRQRWGLQFPGEPDP